MVYPIIKRAVMVIIAPIFLVGCGKTLDFRNTEISNNKIFAKGENAGFSGKVTNIRLSDLPANGIRPITNLLFNLSSASKDPSLSQTLNQTAVPGFLAGALLCDATTSDGMLDGDTVCKISGSDSPFFELAFKKNTLNGKFVIKDVKKNKETVAEATYVDGNLNGEIKMFSANTGKLIHKGYWENGVMNGKQETYDESTGNVVYHGNFENGRLKGEAISYSPDGKVVQKCDGETGMCTMVQ